MKGFITVKAIEGDDILIQVSHIMRAFTEYDGGQWIHESEVELRKPVSNGGWQ